MAIQKISIQQFIDLSQGQLVLDVRSPGEYNHAHIPGAHSLPLFSNEERAVVGTLYKQQSRKAAIKTGLDYFGPKMRSMVETVEGLLAKTKDPAPAVFVHCWRGGMRSAGVAWLLDLYGFKVYTIVGGYKAYRKWVRDQFEQPYPFSVLGGYTGSGKTGVLESLLQQQESIIHLEALANHKGSAFGAMGEAPQPPQEMFENLLANALYGNREAERIWIEDESQRIGNLKVPDGLWVQMRKSPVYFIDIPFEQRLDYITASYGKFDKERLIYAIVRIQKRLGGLDTKNAINYLVENNYKECFRILLRYYDKWYSKGLQNRDNLQLLLRNIGCDNVDPAINTSLLLQHARQNIPVAG